MHLRPKYHFTPPKNWMNDPNGLIYHNGLYHLYYQHNPHGNEFGNISWGHATSKDLLSWDHHPVALRYSDTSMIYSGCTVVNEHGNICAIYTEHCGDTEIYHEQICLAESSDGGFTFDQENRTVILTHSNPDFRDPKVFWHDKSRCWIMCVALPKNYIVQFYRSSNLLDWALSGEFGSPHANRQYWECPDLFPLIDERGTERWVLSLSGEHVDGQSWGMFYFIGDFDGKVFTSNQRPQPMDHGSDYYAGITFEGLEERIMIAWCGNWAYANELNRRHGSGVMSSPRKLRLKNNRIIQELISKNDPQKLVVKATEQEFQDDHYTINWSKRFVKLNRSKSQLGFSEKHQDITYWGEINELTLLLDTGIVEGIINHGEIVLTVRV